MFGHQRLKKDWKETVKAFWNFATSNTGAFILGVTAIFIGYYQFYVSRPILKYDTHQVTFISSQNQNDYSVNVHGNDYQDLYLTRVFLYNRGQQALSGSDVSKIGHEPIRIAIPKDAKLVHYTLDKTATSEAITANLEKVNGDLVLKFDYLNPDYQITASLLHENPNVNFEVAGSALNVNEITKEWSDKELKFWGLLGLGILYLILVAIYIYNHWYKKRRLWKRY